MRSNPNVINRMCIVRDLKEVPKVLVAALIIDKVAGTNKAKRIRLQSGEHFGEVRMIGEYDLIEFCERGEAPACLAAAWV